MCEGLVETDPANLVLDFCLKVLSAQWMLFHSMDRFCNGVVGKRGPCASQVSFFAAVWLGKHPQAVASGFLTWTSSATVSLGRGATQASLFAAVWLRKYSQAGECVFTAWTSSATVMLGRGPILQQGSRWAMAPHCTDPRGGTLLKSEHSLAIPSPEVPERRAVLSG